MTLKEIQLCLFILIIFWLCVQWLTKNETFLYFYRALRVPGLSLIGSVGLLLISLSKDFGEFEKWTLYWYELFTELDLA